VQEGLYNVAWTPHWWYFRCIGQAHEDLVARKNAVFEKHLSEVAENQTSQAFRDYFPIAGHSPDTG
jgi:hypothetical protein